MELTPKQELMVFTFKGLNQLQAKVLELQASVDWAEDMDQEARESIYNEISSIEEAIESLKNQMRVGFEAIMTDTYDPQNAQAVGQSNSWLQALTGGQ